MQQGAVGSLAIVGDDDARLIAVNFDTPLVASWSLTGNGLIDHLVARGRSLPLTAAGFSRDGLQLIVDNGSRSSLWDPSADTELGPNLGGLLATGWLSDRTITGVLRSSPTHFVRSDLNGSRLENRMTLALPEVPDGGAGSADGSRVYLILGKKTSGQ